jgi:hypothetical protein
VLAAIALGVAASAPGVCCGQTRPPPPPLPPANAEVARPPLGQIPPEGEWVWQGTPYGGRYWAWVKRPDLRNYPGFHTPGQ